jgi:HSP20 family protein
MNTNKELALFEPGAFMRRVLRDVDRMFERPTPFFGNWRANLTEFPWVPELEVFQRNGLLTARLDLPGIKKEEVTITVSDGYLTIEGERKSEKEEKKNEWERTERTYGRFLRTILIPEGIDPKAVKATFTNGVLEVTLPVPEVAQAPAPYKVAIEGEPPAVVKPAA